MAYQKRKSSDPYEKLSYRLEALKTFDPDFDLGNGLNVVELENLANRLDSALNDYNETLMDADDLRTTIRDLEKEALDAAERLLATALAVYGRDSKEYRRVGGTRKSEIRETGTRPLTYEPPLNGSNNNTNTNGGGSSSMMPQKKDS